MAKLTPIRLNDARTGIYIDFEGTMKDPPSMLGILHATDDGDLEFDQPVFETELWPAARYTPPKNEGYATRPANFVETIEQLRHTAMLENRKLFAFSSHEFSEIMEKVNDPSTVRWWEENLVNVLQYAKKWAKKRHPDYVFKKTSYRSGKYSLDQFFDLIEYPVPTAFGPGNSAKRIRDVREALVKRDGDWSRLTRTQKAKWTKAMKHNWHDCEGTRQLMIKVASSGSE